MSMYRRFLTLGLVLAALAFATPIVMLGVDPGAAGSNKAIEAAREGLGADAVTTDAQGLRIAARPDAVSAAAVRAQFAPAPIDVARFLPENRGRAVTQVEFALPEHVRDQLTPRAEMEQLRDWLLFAAAAQHSSDPQALRNMFFDHPVVRYGHMKDVSTFEFGPTRGRSLGDGRAVALIPADLVPMARRDAIADVADALRADIGEPFERLLVYEYRIDTDRALGLLIEAPGVEAADAFSDAYGYVERVVASADDLAVFMRDIDDIVHADVAFVRGEGADSRYWSQFRAQGRVALTLGGRRLQGRDYRGIAFEDVAALFQAERRIAGSRRDFDAWADHLRSQFTYRSGASQAHIDALARQYQSRVLAEQRKRRIVDGSGFSLDPTYDFVSLAAALKRIGALDIASASPAALEAEAQEICRGQGVNPSESDDFARNIAEALTSAAEDGAELAPLANAASEVVALMMADEAARPIVPDLLNGLASSLRSGGQMLPQADDEKIAHVYRFAQSLGQRGDVRSALVECAMNASSFQAARYDGPLEGTEVGMVLFYTDLLAKLWAIRYEGADPSVDIDGFVNLYNQQLEAVFQQESFELPSARLWFGHNNAGFAVGTEESDRRSLMMRRVATRIYAAGSNPLNPGEEVQTSRLMGAPMKWWNDYYAEVAAYEPEYERLNQIMKWSLVLGWLNDGQFGPLLSYLDDAEVTRGRWFPDWAREQDGLQFDDWGAVPFFERGFLGKAAETLPRLKTYGPSAFSPFRATGFSGGVSLAPKDVFKARSAASRSVPEAARRSFTDYAASRGGRTVTSLDGPTFSFFDHSVSVVAKAADGVRRQGVGGELVNRPVTRAFDVAGDLRAISVDLDGQAVGRLYSEPARDGGLRIGFESREVDLAFATAHRAAGRRGALSDRVAGLSDSGVAMEIGAGRAVAPIGARGKWVELALDDLASMELPTGWTGRAGRHLMPDGVAFRLADDLADVVPQDTLRAVVVRSGERGGVVLRLSDEAAPTGGQPVSVRIGADDVTLRRLEDGRFAVDVEQLPAALRREPWRLADFIGEAELVALKQGRPAVAARQASGHADELMLAGSRRSDVLDKVLENAGTNATRLRATLDAGVQQARRHIRQGEPRTAIDELARLERVFGDTPDIALTRGLAELDLGRLAHAARSLNSAPGRADTARGEFVREVGRRLGGGGRPPEPPFPASAAGGGGSPPPFGPSGRAARPDGPRDSGGTLRLPLVDDLNHRQSVYDKAAKLIDHQRRNPGSDDLFLHLTPDGMELGYKLRPDLLAKALDDPAAAVSREELRAAIGAAGRARTDIYVQGGERLGRLDWSEGALPKTLLDIVDGGLGRVVRAPIGDAAAYRPSALYADAETVFHRATRGGHAGPIMDWPTIGHVSGRRLRALPARLALVGAQPCDEEDERAAQEVRVGGAVFVDAQGRTDESSFCREEDRKAPSEVFLVVAP